tara:strand:- start:331 stop:636 length:306 start_codon:yes stop_codon:yes gene_type:complete
MAKRHTYTRVKKNKLRQRVFGSTILPSIPLSSADIYIYSKFGDRLDTLAFKYYDDVSLWWIIAKANHLGQGSLNIKPGTQIRIPQNLQDVFASLEHRNVRG